MDEVLSTKKVESELRKFILKSSFWTNFINITNKHFVHVGSEHKCVKDLTRLFEDFREQLKPWLEVKDEDILERQLLIIKAGLLLKKPKRVDEVFKELYENSFEAYKTLHRDIFNVSDELQDELQEDEEEIYCNVCNKEKDHCQCYLILENLTGLNNAISRLHLIDHLCNPAIVNLIYNQLTGFIDKHIKGEYDEPWIERVFTWMNKGLVAWLELITSNFEIQALEESSCLTVNEWRERLSYFVYKAFAEMRISELFEIIVEYPDSLPAIHDLKECLAKTETRQFLAESLRTSFEKRLLHPAVNTDDILTQYVSAIRTLRELDPSGVILENVCFPLREYLRNREDTIKCIITCLTNQGTGPDLANELFNTDDADPSQENDVESDGEDWEPDPIDAITTDLSTKSHRTADIINILVNIYGSQDMFVSQYRVLLADRILTNFSYDISNERRYIELLKRRFGENHLLYCDVMLKDIQDSQRINRHIKDELEKEKNKEKEKEKQKERKASSEKDGRMEGEDLLEFNSFILSCAFWPTLSEETVEPPDYVKKLMDEYMESYKRSKGMRTLQWLNNLGSVEIEVELDDGGIKTFNATPAQATLLLKFQEKEDWNLNDLSTQMNINKTSLRSRISFWIGQGVILEKQNDVFATAQSFQTQVHDASMYESDEDTGAASAQNQKDEELQIYWSYVVGMLTNIGSLPLDRIHSMLKMFASHDTSMQCTQEEVKTFLQGKVADGELLYVGGMYKLPKSS